ncbi:MAG TPA: hypothetical protein VMA54_21640 [Steroidobacteraceae bacterium]|nr:hypothetical protein [Steroidobacteraceae bacterium]
MTLVTLMLLGLGFLMLLGLLSLIREFFTESQRYVPAAEDDSRMSNAIATRVRLQSERR